MTLAPLPAPHSILENGDRLSRVEFERRYAASQIKKAELIAGIVYVASPLRFLSHGKPHSQLTAWLIVYQTRFPDLEVGIEPTVRLDEENEPQPDIVLFRVGGNARIDQEGYITGAPELVVEIAASSVSYDLHAKKQIYEAKGVQEYIVWRTLERQVDWFVLDQGRYQPLAPDELGILRSREFPGLSLHLPALLRDDIAMVLRTLDQGCHDYDDRTKRLS
jgi:Uma2 family endonuclease